MGMVTKRRSDYEASLNSRNDRFIRMNSKGGVPALGTVDARAHTQRSSLASRGGFLGNRRKVGSVAGFAVMSTGRNSFAEGGVGGGNESGIKFFDGKINAEGFEVRVDTTEFDFRNDML